MLVLFSLFILPLLFLFILSSRSHLKSNFPPSPPRLPVIGNIHQLGTLVHRSLRDLSEKYGPLMLLHLGQVPTLVVSSPEILQEIVKSHDIAFSNRPKTTAANIFCYGCKDLGFAPYGEHWRQARKLHALELLSLKRVQQFHFVREEEIALLVKRLRKASSSGDAINISDMVTATSNNVVSRCILGRRFEDENGESRFGELTRKVMIDFMAFSVGDYFPKFWWIDVLRGFIGRLNKSFRELDTFFDQILEERKAKMKNGNGAHMKEDFVDILLRLQKDGMLDFPLAQDNIKGFLMDLFVGASDTTSTTLEWLMAELVRNPRVMKKVQEDVRRVWGNKQDIDMNDIHQMEYLTCVIKENLRLHPPLALLIARQTSESLDVAGYNIPSKSTVFVNAWAIHRNPSLWDKPEEFLPERFENNPVDFKLWQDFQYIPFGLGRRGCPGLLFGLASTEYIIANLLYHFDWKLPDDNSKPDDLDMSEVYGLTVQRKVPLKLVPISYTL
ncbi:hypothetical protein TIFTF001_026025 [Ficus carica]|uniref:Cytochrome P450 n=1 Tax=Ficus carica TaxID=3494 RepID=A0AA88AK35_FICCA|nr:hypothetical protein TIFTF001_026025 [Ficus carica]